MKIGIIFAMKEEFDAFKDYITIDKSYKIFEIEFHEGKKNGKKIILVEGGIGKVNAARTTQILIDNFKVDMVFNIGVAGGISNDLKICDIVIGEKLVQHDFDITAFDHEKGYIPNIGSPYIYSDEYLIRKSKDLCNKNDIHYGIIASGDIFCTDSNMSAKINKKFNALCVEMEAASIAQVCHLCNIPFLIIRSISDIPNNNNTITYEDFLEISSKKAASYLSKLISTL